MPRPLANWLPRLAVAGQTVSAGLLQLVYPNLCWTCGASIPDEPSGFCDPCRSLLTTDRHETCPRCSSTVGQYSSPEKGCMYCRDDSFWFERTIRLGPYQGLLRDVILRIKHGDEGLGERMAQLWANTVAERLQPFHADLVLPVPLHWMKQWTRGFNQSQLLAHALARRLQLPYRTTWLRRSRRTPPQAHLTGGQARRENVRGAFALRRFAKVQGKTILLVDDVLTSGSTASEAARPLRKAGAKTVIVAVLGHGK